MFRELRHLVPKPFFSAYHLCLAGLGAFLYGFPSRSVIVIGVTGTKGKSSTTEYLNAIFEAHGWKTALLNSIRIKIGTDSKTNTMRMSMPGRFYIQAFLRKAVRMGCRVAILEMTSEGARQHRHRFLDMNAFVFTNLAPEHIESHGSLEAYASAKFSIGLQLARSKKRPRIIVANAEDAQSPRYLTLPVEVSLPATLAAVKPWSASDRGGVFRFEGADIHVRLPGVFSLKNALLAAMAARALGIPVPSIQKGIESLAVIPGRAEEINAGQNFTVVVDYAHTPDSLSALYDAYGNRRKICVLGATGGGRDTWKRPVMGKIAEESCSRVILTNEDPYDEEPRSIVEGLISGMKQKPEVVMDRREAIRTAFSYAREGDVVLITGKGTDPNIAGPRGEKTPWSDAEIAREELKRLSGQDAVV
jgi:UDP-N-acetylmuramoyl-L-alanyl-D-glutamate--2,6-diaminopimelate ligase